MTGLGPETSARARAVLEALARRNATLAVAESCTGGALGAALTGIPGASRVFLGGVIAYADRVKEELLGVPAAVLRTAGAVSAETAEAMALGARQAVSADWAVAITGVAGPAGGTPARPVGTVWIAAAGRGHLTAVSRRFLFPGSRDEIRASSVRAALELLSDALEQQNA